MSEIGTTGIIVCLILVVVAIAGMFLSFKYGYNYRKKFAESKIGSAESTSALPRLCMTVRNATLK